MLLCVLRSLQTLPGGPLFRRSCWHYAGVAGSAGVSVSAHELVIPLERTLMVGNSAKAVATGTVVLHKGTNVFSFYDVCIHPFELLGGSYIY